MAILYSHTVQGVQRTVGTGAPSHTGILNELYFDVNSGLQYTYISGAWKGTSTSGKVGISDSNGSFTYYSDLQTAINDATVTDAVHLFTNITINSEIILRDVNIEGNGHTVTLDSSGTGSTFKDQGIAVNCSLNNIKIRRINGETQSTTSNAAMLITGASTIKGNYQLYNGNGCSLIVNNANARVYGFDADGFTTSNGYITVYVAAGRIYDGRSVTRSNGTYQAIFLQGANTYAENCFAYTNTNQNSAFTLQLGTCVNCVAINESINGNTDGFSSSGTTINCIGKSNIGTGFANAGLSQGCEGNSLSGYGYYNVLGGRSLKCSGYSASNKGFYSYNGIIEDCTGTSLSDVGMSVLNGNDGTCGFHSGTGISYGSSGVFINYSPVYPALDVKAISYYNSVNGHGIEVGNYAVPIVDATVRVVNSSAFGIYSAGTINLKYANVTAIGCSTLVNTNITQAVVNTQDNQGNILM